MTSDAPTIRDLQDRAKSAAMGAASARQRRRSRLSRSARLHLIDVLSRWGGSGLALIAGITIFIAVFSGRTYPLRAGVWVLIVLGALYCCRRLRHDYRAGKKIASRPFRWRANYTSSLCVLSAAFGAGAFLTTPSGTAGGALLQTAALILAGSVGAAALHIAHGRSVAAIIAPAALFLITAIWLSVGAQMAIFGAGAMTLAASAALFLASRQLQQSTAVRFPRTGLLRRDTARGDVLNPGRLATPRAANAG